MKKEIMQMFSEIYNDTEILSEKDQELFIKMIIAEYIKNLIEKKNNDNNEGEKFDEAIKSIELFLQFLTSKKCREIAEREMPESVRYLHRREEVDA